MMVVQRRRELAGRSSAKRGENSVSHDAISADRRCKRPRITNRRTNLAEEIEQSRRLPLALVENMARVGLFRLRVPRAIGGEETDPMTLVRVVEEISRADGAARWSVALSGEYGIFGGLLPEASAREIYGSDPDVRTAGTLRASGTARVIEGGYRVTGRWQLGSGCQHSKWLVGGCQIMDGNEPRLRPNGSPVTRILFVPADECEIIDTWHSIGLRGTGSHDYAVADVFVPADHSFSFREPPVDPGPLYAMPTIALFCTALAAVSLGIARHAIDILLDLAQTRTSRGGALREDTTMQAHVGQSEALLRSGRAFLYEALDEAWQVVKSGRTLSPLQRAMLWVSSTHAAHAAKEATELMFSAGSSASPYSALWLERCVRDIQCGRSAYLCHARELSTRRSSWEDGLGLGWRDMHRTALSTDTQQMSKNIPAKSGNQQNKQHFTPPEHSRASPGILVPAIWNTPVTELLV
jgi:indole-3-acetate monooxygenase